MTPASITDHIVRTFSHVVVAEAYGDLFFFYNPLQGGANEVYFATVKVSDHDLDKASGLDRLGAFRLNIGVGRETFLQLFGSRWSKDHPPSPSDDLNYGEVNVLMPHPVYAGANWLCVVNPSAAMFSQEVAPLLAEAYERAVRQHHNRRGQN